MFVGKQDDLANPIDTRWAREQIKTTQYYEEIDDFDHGSFTIGKDMSYLKKCLEILNIINHDKKMKATGEYREYLSF